MFFSSLVMVMALIISYSIYHKTAQTIDEISQTKQAITQVSLTQVQLQRLNVRDLDSPPNTYYLENIDASTLPQIDGAQLTSQIVTTSKEKVGVVLDNFFILQETYQDALASARQLSNHLETHYSPVSNSELTTIYLDLHAQVATLPNAILQELEMLKDGDEISITSLNEAIIFAKTSYTQLAGVCLPKDEVLFVRKLTNLVDHMQMMLRDGETYFSSHSIALSTLSLLNKNMVQADNSNLASHKESAVILMLIMAGLFLTMGVTLFSMMRSRNFMLMNAMSKEDLESENLVTIKSAVEHLIESVNQTWMDSKGEARIVDDMANESRTIDEIMTNIEAELENVHQDSIEIHSLRKQIESLYQSTNLIEKKEILPLVKHVCDLEISLYQHEDDLHSDVEAMSNTTFSIRNDLITLRTMMDKLIKDTEQLKSESNSLEENGVIMDTWDH